MRSKSEMRYTIYRMIDVLYSLELMNWVNYWNVYWAADAEVAYAAAYGGYYKGLEEAEDEK